MTTEIGGIGADLSAEEPQNPTLAEADRWLDIYDRLIDFTNEMLRRTHAALGAMPGPAGRHISATNIRVMDEEIAIFEVRRDMWRGIRERLGTEDAPAP